eukprot:NODE_1463_length_1154_cov_52.857014_g1198_i0.p4 GENE.NODE_1463_length_1154_cov_52.857014_g1198_i0~~NODE_1463_length_1154_cov_52.857014_g1198_i0.p4  ORF type:complete len:57 (+),score=3.40 NODE_1463_length_1154_cov_52.857014_g1198_i0:869-1039(+)
MPGRSLTDKLLVLAQLSSDCATRRPIPLRVVLTNLRVRKLVTITISRLQRDLNIKC